MAIDVAMFAAWGAVRVAKLLPIPVPHSETVMALVASLAAYERALAMPVVLRIFAINALALAILLTAIGSPREPTCPRREPYRHGAAEACGGSHPNASSA